MTSILNGVTVLLCAVNESTIVCDGYGVSVNNYIWLSFMWAYLVILVELFYKIIFGCYFG